MHLPLFEYSNNFIFGLVPKSMYQQYTALPCNLHLPSYYCSPYYNFLLIFNSHGTCKYLLSLKGGPFIRNKTPLRYTMNK